MNLGWSYASGDCLGMLWGMLLGIERSGLAAVAVLEDTETASLMLFSREWTWLEIK